MTARFPTTKVELEQEDEIVLPETQSRVRRRVALVTGSSRGTGRAIASALAWDHDIVVHYRRRESDAVLAAEGMRALGARVIVQRAELEDPAELQSMVDAAVHEFGFIDSFIANAAAGAFVPLTHSKHHHVTRTFATIVTGFTDLIRYIIPHMPSGGRIVVVSGTDSTFAGNDHALIGAAKAALESLIRNLAVELGPRGITANAIVPGPIVTESLQHAIDVGVAELADLVMRSIPAGRLGEPEDMADVVRFLCSASARYVSGVAIPVDGGLSAGGGPGGLLELE